MKRLQFMFTRIAQGLIAILVIASVNFMPVSYTHLTLPTKA